MSDCEHAAYIFERFYLMDEFVSGKTCPYCRIAELEAALEKESFYARKQKALRVKATSDRTLKQREE